MRRISEKWDFLGAGRYHILRQRETCSVCRAGSDNSKSGSGIRTNSKLVEPPDLNGYSPAQGPVHLQRFIKGYDLRVHVVSREICATKIVSKAVDYRRPEAASTHAGFSVPEPAARMIERATSEVGLIFAGWDLKVDEAEQFWVLEANPMPGYDGYDRRLGGRISSALVRYLGCGRHGLAS